MKKFAVILIIAVLALGCVFAKTSGDSKNANNNESFVVYTKVNQVYPVYEIVGSNGQTSGATATSKDSNREIIEAKLSDNGESVSITATLNHFGKVGNLMENDKTDIRYKGAVHVQIEATKLLLETDGSISGVKITDTENHVAESALPKASDQNYSKTTLDNFTSEKDTTVTPADNKLNVLATYTNGKKVLTGSESKAIASCIFTWDISDLTAGDTYKADIIVTYTVE